MINYRFDECIPYQLPQGVIYIGLSNENTSFGYLELEGNNELALHNRPIAEELIQIEGESTMILFDGDNEKKIILKKGDYLKIPANQNHIHKNRKDTKSLTLWKFEGDIQKIVENIKNSFPKKQ